MDLLGVRILVVDDRPDSQEVFGEIFDALGAETRSACSAVAALQELETFSAHVVLSDLEMPELETFLFAPARRVFEEWLSVRKPERRRWPALLHEGVVHVG